MPGKNDYTNFEEDSELEESPKRSSRDNNDSRDNNRGSGNREGGNRSGGGGGYNGGGNRSGGGGGYNGGGNRSGGGGGYNSGGNRSGGGGYNGGGNRNFSSPNRDAAPADGNATGTTAPNSEGGNREGGPNREGGNRNFNGGPNRDGGNRNFGGGNREGGGYNGGGNRNFSGGGPNRDGGNRNFGGGGPNRDGGNRNFSGGGPNRDGGNRNFSGGGPNRDGGNRNFGGPNRDGGNRNFGGGTPGEGGAATTDAPNAENGNREGGNRNFSGGGNRNFGGPGGPNRDGGFRPGGGGGFRPGGGGGAPGRGGPGAFAGAVPVPTGGRNKRLDRERDKEREKMREKEFDKERDNGAGGRKGQPGTRPGAIKPGGRSQGGPGNRQPARTGIIKRIEVYELPPQMTVKDLADELGIGSGEIIRELIKNGVMASINQQIDYDTASIVASELGFETTLLEPQKEESDEPILPTKEELAKDPEAETRPPVVTIMGHVDHGKTKLLDAIRSTNVVAGEAGGITQRIGAYQVEISGKRITFIDTPGHEAFTQMRARGAQVTDIVILVVAADDGVMPQTLEALSHAKAANVPIIVAVNKVDKEGANPELVKTQLSEAGLMPEDWGGETPFVHVSAKQKIGIDDLLEMILLVAEIGELKANPHKLAIGTVVEAELDKNRGPVASVLVQNGTLSERDYVVVGHIYGKVRALMDDRNRRVRRATPGTPVVVLGLDDVPGAGDVVQVVADEKIAKEIVERRIRARSMESQQQTKTVTLDDLFSQIQAGKVKELRVIVKADNQGSVEAIKNSLEKLSNEQVTVKTLFSGTGAIGESDVLLASASQAIILGFNVRPDPAARRAADKSKVDIRFYNIIYNLLDEVKAAMSGLLEPTYQDITDGYAEVRQVFKVGKTEQFAGLMVTDGKITRNGKVRVLRNGAVMFDGDVDSLRRFKDNVTEVSAGYECGIGLTNFNDFSVSDMLEFYHKEQIKATIA